MGSSNRKEWKKPELLVLLRNSPEESVLAVCKTSGGGWRGTYWDNCSQYMDEGGGKWSCWTCRGSETS